MYGLERSYGERLAAVAATLAITVAIGLALMLELLNPAAVHRSDRQDVMVLSISKASEDDRDEARPARDAVAAPPSAAKPALPAKRSVLPPPLPSPATTVAPLPSPAGPPAQQAAASEASASGDAAPATASVSDTSGALGRSAAQGGAPEQRAEDRYAMDVYRRVAARIRVTPAMREAGSYGTGRVRLTIDMEGRLIEASLVASSGHAEIDRIAVAQARSAAPFPRRPKYSGWTQRSFVIPMTYRERR